jgi:5-methylthioadenosine/S-adenosylhomocysteine deaminase
MAGVHANPVSAADPYSLLVYALRSSDVEMTMVDGRILMENRALKTIEQERIIKTSNLLIMKLRERAGIA